MVFQRNRVEFLHYAASCIALSTGLVYLLVPLYKLYCKKTGFSGSPTQEGIIAPDHDGGDSRTFKVKFMSSIEKNLPWQFYSLAKSMVVKPGKPALAFYRARNDSIDEITGLATYNILPQRAAGHFNKIQCFCFEKQTLGPGEEVDMPVYFYVDSKINEEPGLQHLEEIILSYSFFRVRQNE